MAEDSNEKAEESIEGNVKERVEIKMQGRDERKSDNPLNSRTDSSKTTLSVDFKNRQNQQTITHFYKFRGRRK